MLAAELTPVELDRCAGERVCRAARGLVDDLLRAIAASKSDRQQLLMAGLSGFLLLQSCLLSGAAPVNARLMLSI